VAVTETHLGTFEKQHQQQTTNKLVLKIRKSELRYGEASYCSNDEKSSAEVKKASSSTKKTICKLNKHSKKQLFLIYIKA